MRKKTTGSNLQLSNPAQTILLAGFLLVAFAIFLSQISPLFVKAAPGQSNIRGTIVLADRGTFSQGTSAPVWASDIKAPVALPGTSCSVIVSGCMMTTSYGNSITPDILFDDSMKAIGTFISYNYNNGDSNSKTNAQKLCQTTTPFAVPGGLHTLKVQTPSAAPGGASPTYIGISYAAIAYDCTP